MSEHLSPLQAPRAVDGGNIRNGTPIGGGVNHPFRICRRALSGEACTSPGVLMSDRVTPPTVGVTHTAQRGRGASPVHNALIWACHYIAQLDSPPR